MIVICVVPMAPLASTAAAFRFSSILAAAVKNLIRSSSSLGGRVVEDTLVDGTLVDVEPVPFELVSGAFAHDAPMRTTRANATTVLRTTASFPRSSQLSPSVAQLIGPEVPPKIEHSQLG